ncbi:MAG: NAD-binding protein [Methanobacterium paludis]|nr:NAD-binding protein [Methanobacterium paludis]
MHIVVMGSGIFGLNLALSLISDGHDITLLENDENKCNKVANKLDAEVLCGNGTDAEILEESNIEDADVFVAATENDEVNLLACIMVKGYNVPRIISQVSDPNHKGAFNEIGIDIIINPELYAANYIEKLITRPKIADITVLGKGDTELIDLNLEKGEYIGQRIGDVSPKDNFSIVAIYEKDEIIFPKPDVILKPGMKISILVKSKNSMEVLERFTEENTETEKIEIFPGIKVGLYQPPKK